MWEWHVAISLLLNVECALTEHSIVEGWGVRYSQVQICLPLWEWHVAISLLLNVECALTETPHDATEQ